MERLVATEMTFESPVRVEFDLPQRSSCRIRDKEIASGIKGKAIGDEILWVIGSYRGLRRLYG